MKMTYTKSAFEMPDGKYVAKFRGVTYREDRPGDKPRIGQDGNPLPPAMTWDFEIAEGPEAGKKCDKLTGRIPTPKSGCGKMLVAITDTILKDGAEVDLDQFVGKRYRITVLDNRVSDNPAPTRLYDEPASFPNSPTIAGLWDYSDGVDVVKGATLAAVQAFLATPGLDVSRIKAKPAGAPPTEAKPVAEIPGMVGLKADGTPAAGSEVPW